MTDQWQTKKTDQLFKAILLLKNESEVAKFCRDLMTESEIQEFAGRFDVAKTLYSGESQRETAKKTGVSVATVTRVNQWLRRGMNGYKTVLDRMYNKQNSEHHHLH